MHDAFAEGNVEVVRSLLDEGADVDEQQIGTAFTHVHNTDPQIVRWFLWSCTAQVDDSYK